MSNIGDIMAVLPHEGKKKLVGGLYSEIVGELGQAFTMSLYLCVDCGGTKTSAVICNDDGSILGRAAGGPSNVTYLSPEAFLSSVSDTISNALQVSNQSSTLPPDGRSPFSAAWFGVSGADSPASIAKITPSLSALLAIPAGPRLVITNDTHLLAAPVRMYPDVSHAVTVIAGTGSNAVSFVEKDGVIEELARVGGWGWILGDEGGGFHVGRETIRQILMEEEKASIGALTPAESNLRDRILERFGVKSVMEILGGVYLPDPPPNTGTSLLPQDMTREKRLSSLCPLVFAAAFEDGDWLALRILGACASSLASQIAGLLAGPTDNSPRLVRACESMISLGGSLAGVEQYRKMILDDLAHRGHVFRHVEFIDNAAAVGAMGLAAIYKQGPP